MASDPNRPPRKVKFAPKQPPRRPEKPSPQPKCDAVDETNEEILGKEVNEHLTRNQPQAEKKSPVQVVFAPGSSSSLRTFGKQTKGTRGNKDKVGPSDRGLDTEQETSSVQVAFAPGSSSSLRTYGKQTKGTRGSKDKVGPSDRGLDTEQETSDLPPAVNADDIVESSLNSSSDKSKKKEYKEPWDYKNSYYPITLPLRRPNSGDPEILDEEEFGAKATSMEYDENTKNAALELGLWPEDESDEQKMIFFQLPKKLPLHRRTPRPPDGSVAGSSVSGGNAMSSNKTGESFVSVGGDLEFLPAGYMGKLVVYKSGAVKWKMGDHLFDVCHGASCKFEQDAVAINKAEKRCVALGRIEECRAVVTPDDDSLFKGGLRDA